MNELSREEFVLRVKPLLKMSGFKKKNFTWHKSLENLILVFNIQGSLYSSDYYINVGIYMKELGNEDKPPEYRCHLRSRLDETQSYITILNESMNWFERHDSIEKLKNLQINDKLPLGTNILAKEYLKTL